MYTKIFNTKSLPIKAMCRLSHVADDKTENIGRRRCYVVNYFGSNFVIKANALLCFWEKIFSNCIFDKCSALCL